MSLGLKIGEMRRRKGQSLQDVADTVGVSKTHIWELEKGTSANPSMTLVRALADHFGVTVGYLVDEDLAAPNADDQLAAMFRQARELDPEGRRILNDMLRSLLKRDRDDAT